MKTSKNELLADYPLLRDSERIKMNLNGSIAMKLEHIVNITLYPILDPNSPSRRSLIERCKAELDTQQYCLIPDFVTPAALAFMTEEATRLQAVANHNNALRNCYLHRQRDASLPDDHPRNLQDRSSVRMLAYDQIPSSSPLKTFYHAEAVRSLVAEIVGEGQLFDNMDPYQPANYVSYRDGDESSWHFDADNSFTMTLMVQPAAGGGEFQMSPDTRTDSDQNYDHVRDVLTGKGDATIVSVGRQPGALCIFRGCNSLHRVSPVQGERLRIMGVFVYEFSPGIVGDQEVNATIYGSRVVPDGGSVAPAQE